MAEFLESLRAKADLYPALRGWRNECYETRLDFAQPPVFQVERAGTPLLGLRQYGVHINGFVQSAAGDGQKRIWIQRRADTKPTFPGKYDSFVGGGYATGATVRETAVKELQEEAGFFFNESGGGDSVRLQNCGVISMLHKSERGLHPQTEFVFDLRLPEDFVPANQDGEVQDFRLVSAGQLIELIRSDDYKATSIPVALYWLIRHGAVNSETEPNLPELMEQLHFPLHLFYS